jgi:hypothetical protein
MAAPQTCLMSLLYGPKILYGDDSQKSMQCLFYFAVKMENNVAGKRYFGDNSN